MSSGRDWYILYCKPQQEIKCSEYLSKLHIEHYLPLIERKRIWSDRTKFIRVPLFPGYMFLLIEWQDRNAVLKHSAAVQFLKREDGAPACLADQDIENIRILIASEHDIKTRTSHDFPPGQKVRFHSGPFKGMEGTVHKVKNKARLYVYLPLIGQMASTEVDAQEIENSW